MKTTLTTFFLFIAFLSFGQSNNSLDFVVGIDQTYRNYFATESSDLANLLLANAEGEEPKLNWRLGVNYRKALSENSYLKLGVRLSSLGYQQTVDGLIFGSQLDPLEGSLDTITGGNLPSSATLKLDYWFAELPVSFGWIQSNEKFSIFAEAGLSPNILITTRSKTITDLDKSIQYQKFPNSRTFNLSAVLVVVTFGHGLKDPIWDTGHVMVRALFLIPLLLLPKEWDKFSIDHMISSKS